MRVLRVMNFFQHYPHYLHYKEKTSEKLLQQVAIKKLNWHHNYGTILTNIKMYIDVHRLQLDERQHEYEKYYPGAAARPEYGSVFRVSLPITGLLSSWSLDKLIYPLHLCQGVFRY